MNSFSGDGGFFASPKADWYVVGGRWSGTLQEIMLKGDFQKEAQKLFKDKQFISTKEVEEKHIELQAIWEKMGGKGKNTYERNTFGHDDQEDDCILMTKEILAKLKERYGKEYEYGEGTEVFFPDIMEEHYLKDVDSESVENYYFIVIDYHN